MVVGDRLHSGFGHDPVRFTLPVMSRHRLMLVAGSGGVLLDLLALRPWWQHHDVRWAAVEAADTSVALAGQVVHWQPALAPRARLAIPGAVVRAVRLLRRSKVDLVVSSGGGAALAFFIAARLQHVPTVWVEPLTASGPPGWCARSASVVVVQDPALLSRHPGAVLIGELY
jgi:hypothetical protein